MSSNQYIKIAYQFDIQDQPTEHYECQIDKTSMENTGKHIKQPPRWTQLEFNQCAHCPFDKSAVSHCPAALSLTAVVDQFRDCVSHTPTTTTVRTAERNYSLTGDLQKGLSPLIGLLLATSGCPKFYLFKPMALFHLPFASLLETHYRLMSGALLRHFFQKTETGFNVDDLKTFYQDISTVNQSIAARLANVLSGDSGLNSIVILDIFALTFVIDEKALAQELLPIF